MATIAPINPVRRIELGRLTEDNGFGLPQGDMAGWALFSGLAIPHLLNVARSVEGLWLVGLAHDGVMETLMADHPAEAITRPDGGVAISA